MSNTATTTEALTYNLFLGELEMTRERVAAFNKKAERLGLDARVTLTVGEPETVEVRYAEFGWTTTRTYFPVTLEGTTLALPGGWVLAATLDIADGGNIVRHNPGFDGELPEEFRTTDTTRCDHCGVRRQRNRAVIVHSDTEGFKQVGYSCVQVFLGIDPSRVIKWADDLRSLADDIDGYASGGRHYTPTTAEWVAAAALAVKVYGWSPRSNHFAIPTSSVAQDIVNPPKNFSQIHPDIVAASEATKTAAAELAAASLAWIATTTDSSEYMYNLRTAAARPEVGRNAGLLASLPNAYQRAMGDTAERAAKAEKPASEWLGSVGAKVTLNAEVTGMKETDGDYGVSLFVTLVTQYGEIVWYTTNPTTAAAEALEEAHRTGSFVTVTATVKNHRTNRAEEKVTVVTRAKVTA